MKHMASLDTSHSRFKKELFYAWLYAFASPILFALTVGIVGFITPGYNHLNHTISRLAIEKYGWIQELNFIQFAFGIILSGFLMRRIMSDRQSKRFWLVSTIFSATILIIVSLFPTDPIENVRFSANLLSKNGLIHFASLGLLFLLCPFGVRNLSRTLMREKDFTSLAHVTSVIGYTVSFLCIIWIMFFIGGLFLAYRGIFQKAIALLCIYWIVRVLWVIRKPFIQTYL